ncbi:type III pantothenate kinase [Spirosomataceae bacterium TFI 002]|nr:type III pantothenate kinase [Spirosomataceae bacterium TFI 002]
MYAAVDFGNTLGKLAFFQNGEMTQIEKGLTPAKMIKALKIVKPDSCIICSVTKNISELTVIFESIPNKIFLSQHTPIPIANAYKTPETLGYDRLAAAAGAKLQFPNSAVLIIDMGTAIKYDYVSKEGVFEGGMIGPGLKMRFKALHTFTKKLPLIEADKLPDLVGGSTKDCIQSGVINGMIAEINGIIQRYKQKEDLSIIIAGGDAPFFESQINYPTFAAPNLVLEGLNRILEYNVEKNKLLL